MVVSWWCHAAVLHGECCIMEAEGTRRVAGAGSNDTNGENEKRRP